LEEKVNLRVLNILPNPQNNTCQVMVEIERVQHQFTMTVETDHLGNQPIQIIQGDDKFHALFQWHRELAQKVYELVAQVYNQKHLDFPMILGNFDTSQSQKLFEVRR
jgi:hypothetical protein